jgi:para-aminobenzoate synthetase component 1
MLKVFKTDDPDTFKTKALHWGNSFDTASYFDSNGYSDPYSAFDVFIGAGTASELKGKAGHSYRDLEDFLHGHETYIPGFFSYDLKNEMENLESKNPDHLNFPDIYFFIPLHTLLIKGFEVFIYSNEAEQIWQSVNAFEIPELPSPIFKSEIKSRFNRDEYIATVQQLQKHIRRGDIYEVNFCQEFYAENTIIDPLEVFIDLNKASPTPFANFFKVNNNYIISASPERFLSRRGNKLISQPIKGTSPRASDPVEDELQRNSLANNEKELAENVMIVDLVRNDLTKSAKPGTVRVEELFGIYSFEQVHQMISTVVCKAANELSNTQIIANTFPMGSMTGAPKISAMRIAEQYERSKRGIYSGAAGYFAPDGNFDFNVIIRSILFNSETGYLSFHVGSAITLDSSPAGEYDECILKGKAITEVLTQKKFRNIRN